MKLNRRAKHIIAIGGGKGGVGKSIFAIALATDLARQGKKVVIADFDLGGANLHTYLGVYTKRSIADFFHKKVDSLEKILEDTGVENLKLISGSEFTPGIANPAYWVKLKMIRHVQAIDADFVIIDLGAGVHFNVLDLFGIADRGIIITTPEPGAVINAYSFLKGALFRKIQVVFRGHPKIGPIIKGLMENSGPDGAFTLDWFAEKVKGTDHNMYPLIKEIGDWFRPQLVVNMSPEDGNHILIKNLQGLCRHNLGVGLEQIGSIPPIKEIPQHLTNIPAIFDSYAGAPLKSALNSIAKKLGEALPCDINSSDHPEIRSYFDDETIKAIIEIMDRADSRVFENTSRKLWKLRLFFKPEEVVTFLVSKGVRDELFYR